MGGGHFTSGQRGRGHAGHSPQSFLQAELSMITGSGFGMELLRRDRALQHVFTHIRVRRTTESPTGDAGAVGGLRLKPFGHIGDEDVA